MWKLGAIIPAVWALAPDNGGSSVASAKTARKITASPCDVQAGIITQSMTPTYSLSLGLSSTFDFFFGLGATFLTRFDFRKANRSLTATMQNSRRLKAS